MDVGSNDHYKTMANSISRRHHYIPQFLIKGFTGTDGRLAVYDLRNRQLCNKRLTSKQVFFEWNRNTFDLRGEETDFVEDLYAALDNRFAPFYQQIVNQKGALKFDVFTLLHLIFLIGCTYWRVPKTDEQIQQIVSNSSLEKLHLDIKHKITNESAPQELISRIISEPAFVESYRVIKPMLDYLEANPANYLDDWQIYYSRTPVELHLIGDNPIILKNDNDTNIFANELFFPLSKGKLLIHNKGKKLKVIQPPDTVSVDLLVFLQSERFVCGPDGAYLETIAQEASNFTKARHVELLKGDFFGLFDAV